MTLGKVARIGVQVILSAGFISSGIIVTQVTGLNPIGACLGFTGFCLAFAEEDAQTAEEYRQEVIAHYSERGQVAPRWTR
jgi:hypothetical protein